MHSTPANASLDGIRSEDRPAQVFLLLSLTICILATLSFFLSPMPTLQWFSDYWEHASALRVLAESPLSPTNPHYASYDPDRQFIPLFVALGWLMHVTGISVFTALALAGTVTIILFFLGVNAFARRYFQHRWAPLVTAAVLLFAWGTPWIWTGFYEFRAVFYNSFYPASFVFSLTFITWARLIRALRGNRLGAADIVTLPCLSALMFISHQLGALFALGSSAMFLLFEPRASMKTRVAVFALLAVGVASTWYWPYFNPIKLVLQGSGDKDNDGVPQFYNTLQVLLLVGPAWLGLPLLYDMYQKRIHLACVAGFLGLAIAYVGGGILGHPVAHRFLSYTVVYLHLAIVWKLLSFLPQQDNGVRETLSTAQHPWQRVLLAVVLVCVPIQILFGAVDFVRVGYENATGKSFGAYPSQQVRRALTTIAQAIPDDAVLFATFDPALAVTALKGKVVARPRPQLMIGDGRDRSQANIAFFKNVTTNAERRTLIRKYHATHILIKPGNISPELTAHLEQLGEVVPTDDQLILIKLNPSE